MIDAALLLPKILDAAGANQEMTEVAVKIAWRRAAGSGLRRHAVPFRLYHKTLTVSVADAIWQRQLQPMGAELIFRINKMLRRNAVDCIEFRIDPGTLSRENLEPLAKTATPEPAQLPSELISAAAQIADEELRKHFVRAAGNCIARRDARAQG